jgi:allantoinase
MTKGASAMGRLDTKLVNGTLATSAGVMEADVGMAEGRIAAIGRTGSLPDASEVIDVEGKVILPGGIDTHVHSGDPGADQMFGAGMGAEALKEWDGFADTTQAAALGGVTTVVDMPFQLPTTLDPETFDIKLASIDPRAYVDYALWVTCKPEDLSSIVPLSEKGIVGYKLVMQQSVAGFMPHHHDGALCEALKEIKKTGLTSTIHAESQDMIHTLEEKLKAEGRNDPRAFLDSHPPITELEAVNRALFIAKQLGARINIAHCSLAEGLDMVDRAKQEGVNVTVESCPHYFLLDESIFEEKGTLAKLSPALRDRQNVELMWQKMREGKVDCMGSDHVPFPLVFKQGDIWQSLAGIAGLQTMIPLLLSEGVNKGRIELPQFVKVTSEGAARICGLYPRKGSTQIGADADLAVFDLRDEREVRLEEQYKIEWTLYEGRKAVFPDKVFVRGKMVVDRGKVVGERGSGALCSAVSNS